MTVRIAIVGGGFTGASAAVQLAGSSPRPLDIVVIEPRPAVGPGIAYASQDPDHRLNGSIDSHMLDASDPSMLRRWCEQRGLLERDPEARVESGQLFIRRADFGRFVNEAFGARRIAHHRAWATGLREAPEGFDVATSAGDVEGCSLVLIATGNGAGRLPSALSPLAGHPSLVAEPLLPGALDGVEREARVLVVGAGLTALDALSTLLRRGHAGPIVAISRHGFRPAPQRPPTGEASGERLLARIAGEPPAFARDLQAPTARALVGGLRRRIAECEASGADWFAAFDEFRDTLWQTWPRVPTNEKRRYLRHVRPMYEAHRFRAPPQNDRMVRDAERDGQVSFRKARLVSARADGPGISVELAAPDAAPRSERYGIVINCAGLDPTCGLADNPFLATLAREGILAPDPSGFGIAVDPECRPLRRDGNVSPRLRVVGPPSAGHFGDPLGTLFIAPQIGRLLPGMLEVVGG